MCKNRIIVALKNCRTGKSKYSLSSIKYRVKSTKLTKEEKIEYILGSSDGSSRTTNQSSNKELTKDEREFLEKWIKDDNLMNPGIRKQIWMRGCGAKALMDDNPGYYLNLKNNFLQYPNPWFSQIELDLKRTFPDLKDHATPEKEEKMRNVLGAYIKRNPTVGYWQGMNFIAAILLNYLEEEEAFWVLCQLVEYLLPIDYYTIMTGVIIDQRWLESFVKQKFAKMSKHLNKMGFDTQAIIFQWFVWLFANTFQFDIVARIWDNLFLFGIVTIFQYALAVFEILKKDIVKVKDIALMFELFKDIPHRINDWTVLNAAAEKHKMTLPQIKLQRSYMTPQVYEEFEEQHRK